MAYYGLTYGAIFVCFVLKVSENQVVLGNITKKHKGVVKNGLIIGEPWNLGWFLAIFL